MSSRDLRCCRPGSGSSTRPRPTGTCTRSLSCSTTPQTASRPSKAALLGSRSHECTDPDFTAPRVLHQQAWPPVTGQPPDHRLLPGCDQASAAVHLTRSEEVTRASDSGRPRRRHHRGATETDALLAAPDRATWFGRRDHALLLTATQTGLRLSELTALRIQDVTIN